MSKNLARTMNKLVNTIIIGGGHAGVNVGCMISLDRPDTDYLILERSGALLDKWRSSRWEHFQLNTPMKHSLLYGQRLDDSVNPWLLDRPIQHDLGGWDAHIKNLGIKHQLHSKVIRVSKKNDQDQQQELFHVEVENTLTSERTSYTSRNVVVCNGNFDHPKVPKDLAAEVPSSIRQHTPAGFAMKDLQQDASLLIVGGAQTGVQIADLLRTHRPDVRLFLCTSAVPGCPRRVLARDVFEWLKDQMKVLDLPRATLDGMPPEKRTSMRYGKAPVTGPTKEISPFSLHRRGVELLGHLDRIERNKDNNDGEVTFYFKDNRASNIQTCYNGYLNFLNMIKTHVGERDATHAPEWDNLEPELLEEHGRLSINTADDADGKITDIVWCTGWSRDFSFLDGLQSDIAEDLDDRTQTPDVILSKTVPGLFYFGFPWIGTLGSVNLFSFEADTKVIVDNLIVGDKQDC